MAKVVDYEKAIEEIIGDVEEVFDSAKLRTENTNYLLISIHTLELLEIMAIQLNAIAVMLALDRVDE